MIPVALALALAAPSTAPEITVGAGRLTERQIDEKANAFIRGVLPLPCYGQYARWTQPVCPKVTGIADIYAGMVEARVRAAANAAGVPLATPGCRGNLLIAFSENAAATAGVLARRKPGLVAGLDSALRQRLLSDGLPVRWWHVTEATDGSGVPATSSTALTTVSATGGQTLASALQLSPGTIMTGGYNSSLIDTNLKVSVSRAVVLVDIPLATGKPLDAVADYVALVALAPAQLPPVQRIHSGRTAG